MKENKMEHIDYLRAAYQMAQNSKDPSTQTGAVIVNGHGEIIGAGCNAFPIGVAYTDERLNDRDTKMKYVEHAERNAIFDVFRKSYNTRDLIMYAPWFACADCGRAIIQSGIRKVYGHQLMDDITPDRWKDSIKVARDMMKEAGVHMEWIDGPINDLTLRFNTQIINLIDGQPVEAVKV